MALDFSKTQNLVPATAPVEEEVTSYDIVADRENMTQTLVNSQEVDNLVSQIEISNLETIVSFGSSVAEEISKSSDVILNSMNMSQIEGSSAMLTNLGKIMDKFDIDEIKETPGVFGKFFGNLKNKLD
ncbi:MAG: toxic anion resistance protein, partial [Anaerotignaceae bacterium]